MEHKVTKKDFFKKKLGTADASAKKVQEVKKIKPELIVTMGAGDIDRFVPQIETLLKS